MELALIALIILMILGAIVALESKDLLSAIISLGIVGFALTIIFLMLHAPDLAIVQIVIETITLVILIYAVSKTTHKEINEKLEGTEKVLVLSGAVFVVVFMITAIQVFQHLPEFGHPNLRMAEYYINEGLHVTGVHNLVTAIILDLRGYDTLGEATVLFTSTIGVLDCASQSGEEDLMTVIVKRIAQLMIPSIFMLGIYVILNGHLTPGGGFAGGVLIMGSLTLYVLAFGTDMAGGEQYQKQAQIWMSLGVFIFWFFASLAFIRGGLFFYNLFAKTQQSHAGQFFSGGIIPLIDIGIGIAVAASLFLILITLILFKMKETP